MIWPLPDSPDCPMLVTDRLAQHRRSPRDAQRADSRPCPPAIWELEDVQDNPPGWYRDPDRPKWHRYWDGQDWREPLAEMLEAQRQSTQDAAERVPLRLASRSELI